MGDKKFSANTSDFTVVKQLFFSHIGLQFLEKVTLLHVNIIIEYGYRNIILL